MFNKKIIGKQIRQVYRYRRFPNVAGDVTPAYVTTASPSGYHVVRYETFGDQGRVFMRVFMQKEEPEGHD